MWQCSKWADCHKSFAMWIYDSVTDCTIHFSLLPHIQTFPLSANPSPLVLQPQGTPKQTPSVPSSARRRKVSRLNRSLSMEDSTLTGEWVWSGGVVNRVC